MRTPNPLIGTWRLTSWETRSVDGEISYPLGKNAVGYIMYNEDGYMFVAITRPTARSSPPEIFSRVLRRRKNKPLAPTSPIAASMNSGETRSSIAWNSAYFLTGWVVTKNVWSNFAGID